MKENPLSKVPRADVMYHSNGFHQKHCSYCIFWQEFNQISRSYVKRSGFSIIVCFCTIVNPESEKS